LSVPSGRVAINWETTQKNLTVNWVESGGPPSKAPERQGFGSQIMKATIERQLRGKLRQEWRAQGLRCTFSFAAENGQASEGKPQSPAADQQSKSPSGHDVLLVEDEALVGLMIADFLREIGYRVLGPFTKIQDGLQVANTARLAAAVLDVNIGGEEIYPVAESLMRRNIPFIFVTGYGADGIDERFSGVPVLQKPVDREQLLRVLATRTQGPAGNSVSMPRAAAG
jgi:CheY-like chemotaxis protein